MLRETEDLLVEFGFALQIVNRDGNVSQLGLGHGPTFAVGAMLRAPILAEKVRRPKDQARRASGGWARTASSLMSAPQPGRVGTIISPFSTIGGWVRKSLFH